LTAIAPDKIRSMNSCAINPRDKITYCSMEVYNKGSFLVRIDQENTIGYVTKLLGWRYAATFDYEDNYYVSGQNQLTILRGVSSMTALPSYDGLNSLGETSVEIKDDSDQTQSNYELGADLGVTYNDWEGVGNSTYLVSVKDTDLLVIRVASPSCDGICEGPYKLWTLKNTNLPQGGVPGAPRVWGAAWKWGYNQSVYFAADDGEGLFELLADTVNLTDGTATFEKIAEANPIDWNDGFACGEGICPGCIPPKSLNCSAELYQSLTVGGVSNPESNVSIQHIVETGYADVEEDFKVTSEDLTSINACAVNPLDHVLYCCIRLVNGDRIARVDDRGLAFIQQAPSWQFAAYFDSKGGYWTYGENGLFLISDLDKAKGYSDYKLPAVESKKERWTKYEDFAKSAFKGPKTNTGPLGADFITVEEKEKTYLVSIVVTEPTDSSKEPENMVSVVDITGAPDEVNRVKSGDSAFFQAEGLTPKNNSFSRSWGSAWKTSEDSSVGAKMLFTRDEGGEIWEMTVFDTDTKKIKFEEYSDIATGSGWHDGFTCLEEIKGISEKEVMPMR